MKSTCWETLKTNRSLLHMLKKPNTIFFPHFLTFCLIEAWGIKFYFLSHRSKRGETTETILSSRCILEFIFDMVFLTAFSLDSKIRLCEISNNNYTTYSLLIHLKDNDFRVLNILLRRSFKRQLICIVFRRKNVTK